MKNQIITIFIFTILLVTSVNAFGVTTFYYEGHPLILNPGSARDTQLILQNEKGSDPVTIKVELTSGSDIAQITGRTQFDLNSGANNIPVDIKITLPENAIIGDEYTVGVTFNTVAKPGNKMLELGTQISKSIPVVVSEIRETPEFVVIPKKTLKDMIPFGGLSSIIIVLVLLALVIFIIRKKKKK